MERPIIMLNTDNTPVFCRNQCANTKCAKHITKAYECGGACSMQLLRGATGVRRVHITEEAQMKENVCVDCKYYESCGKPERYIKCMGYEEKERQQAAGEHAVDVQDG
jgi:hypothetical protein